MADRATIGAPPTGLQGALQARYRNSAVARLLVEGRLPEGYSRDAGSPVQPPGQLDLEPPLDLSATGRQQRSSSPEEGQRSDPEPANPLLGNAGVHRRKRKHPAPHPDYPRTSPVKCTYCPFVARSSSMLYSHLQFHQQILSGPSSTSSSHMEWIKAYQKNDSDVTGSGPGPVLAHAPLTTPAEESASTLRNLLQSRENIVTTQNSASGFLKSIVQNILQNGKTPEQSGESRNGSPNPNPEDNAGERQSFQNTSAKHGSRLVERQSPWIPRHDNGIQNVLGSLYCRPSDLSPGLFLPDRKDHVAPGVDPASINPGSWPPADTYQSPGSELGGGGGGGNRKWKRSRGDESRGVLSGGGGENQSSFNLSRVKEEPLTEPAEYGCYPAGVRPPSSGSSGGSHRDTPGPPPHTPPYAPDRPIAPDVLSSHVPAQPASLNIARVSPSSEYTRRDAEAEDPVSAKRVAGSISRETSPKPDRSAQRELSPNRTKTVTQCVLQSVGQQCDVIAPRMGRTPTSPDSSSPTELCETGIQCQLLVPPRGERLEDEGEEEEEGKEGEDPRDRRRLGVRGSGNEDHQDQTPWLGQGEEEATPLRPRPGSSGRPGVLAEEEEGEGGGRASSLHCPHCGIHYDHEVIFSIHMGCHSHGDPFICNVCGRSCGDRFSFYTHIMRGHDAPGT